MWKWVTERAGLSWLGPGGGQVDMTGDRAPLIAGCTIISASGRKPKLMVIFFSDSYLQVFVFNSPLTKGISLPWKTLYFSLQAGSILLTSCMCMHVCVCTSMCACVCSSWGLVVPAWALPGDGTFLGMVSFTSCRNWAMNLTNCNPS